MSRPCLSEKRLLKATAQRGMGAALPWHGICELASAAQTQIKWLERFLVSKMSNA
jgi:hypothetical protein